MTSLPPLFKRVQAPRPGQSTLQSFAREVGAIQDFLDRIAHIYGGDRPSTGLQWDVVKQVLRTLSWLRLREGWVIPTAPAVPSNAPPAVVLAILGDWLITAEGDNNRKETKPITAAEEIGGKPKSAGKIKALTTVQAEVWELLKHRSMTASEISIELLGDQTGEDAMRKRIFDMNKAGWRVSNKRGRGYYRPDALPPDFTTPSCDSG